MSESTQHAAVREGLAAWLRGDLEALEAVLDPAVTLRAVQRGPWDCENREQVMTLLRARAAERPADRSAEVDVTKIDEATYLVSGTTPSRETATLVTVAGDTVTALQQISTARPDPDADRAVAAVRAGDVSALADALAARPDLARAQVPGHQGRTLLHIATDWPGYLPNGPEVVRQLIAHGADPNYRGSDDPDGETPLHWAASNDDVDVAAGLIDGGADIEAPNGSIGTPLDNAVGYGCWHVARLLAERGARVDKLWHAAALGNLSRLDELLHTDPDHDDICQAFWHACAAGQRRAAERLLQAGADLHWIPDYAHGTPLDAATGPNTRQENVIEWLREQGATSAQRQT
jgi:hypothetical protein